MNLKFRAWYVLAEEMIDEILMISFVRKEVVGKFSDGSTSVPLKFEDKRNGEDVILMQSTGLFDKNGKEIFEGDIVQYQNTKVPSADTKGVVKYFDNWAMFGIDVEYNEPRALFFNGLADHISLEVIGTIYESPELLEEEK